MIEYKNSLEMIDETMLHGFFDGWPNPPPPASHMKILRGSYRVWLAVDTEANTVVGFVNAISDGVLSAYIPLIEVLPEYQSKGIGNELIKRMLDSLRDVYMVDLLCDADLQKYYAKFGMMPATGSLIRNFDRQSCE